MQAEDPSATATEFADARTFQSVNAFRGFTLGQRAGAVVPLGGNTCFAATATATNAGQDSDFTIYIDAQGVAQKTCTEDNLKDVPPMLELLS